MGWVQDKFICFQTKWSGGSGQGVSQVFFVPSMHSFMQPLGPEQPIWFLSSVWHSSQIMNFFQLGYCRSLPCFISSTLWSLLNNFKITFVMLRWPGQWLFFFFFFSERPSVASQAFLGLMSAWFSKFISFSPSVVLWRKLSTLYFFPYLKARLTVKMKTEPDTISTITQYLSGVSVHWYLKILFFIPE